MEFQIQDLDTQELPALDGKFLVVETRSDGYTGTVAGNYNYEVEMSENEYYIYPTFWDDYKEKFVRQDALVVYTSGNTVYTAGNIGEDPFSPTEIRKLIVYDYMQKDKRVVQAFKIFANEAFTIGKYNIFVKDVIAKDNPNITRVTGVSISNKNLSLNVGDKKKISYSIEPSNATRKDVEFKSSNTDVVTVSDSGEVTAKANGNAEITVTTVDGNFTDKAKVEVTTAVTGVSLNKNSLYLNKGDQESLTHSLSPKGATNKKVTYASSDTDVATVTQGGQVTAVSDGNAEITVKTDDGGKTAKCTVKVVTPVSDINFTKSELSLEEGKEETLTHNIIPNDASNKNVSYSSNNTDVATVDNNGKVTAKKAGEATITVTTEDGGYEATCKVTVTDPEPEVSEDNGSEEENTGE